jgi:predicted enzyme related to lactoylglutathione lyase
MLGLKIGSLCPSQNASNVNFSHAMFTVNDMSRSVSFYSELFGDAARPIVALPHYTRFAFASGNSLSLHAESRVGPTTTQTAPQVLESALYFECDVNAAHARLAKLGMAFDQLPVDQPWHWREAHLRDPDGHLLVLFQDSNENRRVR